ncbi:MAG: N-acetylneuraminate synthase family protein [Deltaproteobacteria bacterium]|nr:N-acetylneuraminate synthase family protein [Deltaproteobacteria bacterium]
MQKSDMEIIADCSSNHMGDMNIAGRMIELAAEAGIDTIKFQSWQADRLRGDFPDYDATFARHRKAQLSDKDHVMLIEKCNECGIKFLTTCFDINRVDFLASLGLSAIKVASPDCASFSMLDTLMSRFPRLIISTGMSTDEEISKMVEHVRGHDVIILHCVSIYPTPLEKVNLERMQWLKSLGVRVGFSDHSLGTEAGKLALAMGAEILEKHFTLSRYLPGKDQAMSTEISEFKELVDWKNLIALMRGSTHPGLSDDEKKLREIYIGKWGDNR